MKKIISVILSLIVMLVPLVGCNSEDNSVKTLTLNYNKLNLSVFGGADIIATYENVTEITWENSNESVLKMTENGNYVKITAISSGVSTITAKGGDNLTATCVVTVSETDYALSVEIDRAEKIVELYKNGSIYVPATAKYNGEVLDGAKITYSVDDRSIATVTENGVITAVSDGVTTLNVQAESNGVRSNVAMLEIRVKSGPTLVLNSSFVSLFESKKGVNTKYFPNENDFSVSIVDGENIVTDVEYTFEFSNSEIAEIVDGKIIAKSIGQTILTVTCTYKEIEYVGEIYIDVDAIPEVSFSIDKTYVVLYKDAPSDLYPMSAQISALAIVDGKAQDLIEWKVDSGKNVATVNSKGVVKVIDNGMAKVSASFTYGGKKYKETCTVEVVPVLSYIDSHRFYDRSGAYVTISSDKALEYSELTLTNDKNTPFVNFNLIPDDLLQNDYSSGTDRSPVLPDKLTNRNVQFVYVTLTEIANPENSITVGIRVSKDAKFNDVSGYARLGVTASTYSKAGVYFGDLNGNCQKDTDVMLSRESGWGVGARFSFFGKYLGDTTDRYTLGLSIEGTAVYLVNNNTVTKIWDLKQDAIKFEELGYKGLTAKEGWEGFATNKVKLTINGGDYDKGEDTFNLMLLGVENRAVTQADIEKMSLVDNN